MADITTKFKVDLSDFRQNISEATSKIKKANLEFKAASAGMDNWRKSSEGISAKLKSLNSVLSAENQKLQAYKSQLEKTESGEKENAKRAEELRAKLAALEKAGDTTSETYKKYQKNLASVEKEQAANGKTAEDLRNKILNQEASINKTTREIGKWDSELDKIKKSEADAASAVGELTRKIDTQEKELNDLKKSYQNVVLEEGKDSKAAKDLDNQIKKLSQELQANKTTLDNTAHSADNMGDETEEAGKKAKESTTGITAMKVALGNLIAQGIRRAAGALKNFTSEVLTTGQEFDSSMAKVGAVSGATGKDLERLREKAKKMGESTKFSAKESADALNYMAMAGWKTEDMVEGLDGVLNLAAASGADLATTSDIVTDALTAMNYKAKDAGRLADVMAAASSNANTNVNMMGSTFQYAAPIVGTLGYNMEDTAVAIGLLANSGIKGTKAGTALRAIMTRLSTDAGATSKSLGALGTLTQTLGVKFYKADGTTRKLSAVIRDARKAWRGLSTEQQSNYGKTIAGQNALSGWLALMNASEKDVNKLTKAVKKSNGAAKKMSDTMEDNLAGDMTKFRSQMEGVRIKLYEGMVPALRSAMTSFSKFAKTVNWKDFGNKAGAALTQVVNGLKWIIENGSTVGTIVKGFIAALAYVKLMAWTKGLYESIKASTILGAITKANTAAKVAEAGAETTATGAIIAETAAQGASTTATVAGTVATRAFNAAWNANPIGLVISGLIALGTAIYGLTTKTETNTQITNENTEKVKKNAEHVRELATAYNEAKKAREEDVSGIVSQHDHLEQLKSELFKIADETGKVTDKEKARAKVILNELNEALGTEYKLTGNQIEQYSKLKGSISKVIELKKAEALMESYKTDYTEAVKNEQGAYKESKKQLKNYLEALKVYRQKKKEWFHIMSTDSNEQHQKDAQDALTQAENDKNKQKEAWKTAENIRRGYKETIVKYQAAEEAAVKGKTKKVSKILANENGYWDKHGKKVKKISDDKINTISDEWLQAISDAEKTGENMADGVADGLDKDISERMKSTVNKWMKDLKKEVESHSPSKRTAREVGKPMAQGIGVGFEKATAPVSADIRKAMKSMLKNAFVTGDVTSSISKAVTKAENYISSQASTSIKKVTKLVNKAVKKANSKNKAEAKKAGTATIAAYTDAVNKYSSAAKKAVKKALNGPLKEYQAKMEELKNLKEETASLFNNLTKTYSVENDQFELIDPQENLNNIWKLGKAMQYLKDTVPKGLYEEAIAMDPENAIELARAIGRMSAEERSRYLEGWQLVQDEKKGIVKNLYSDDTQALKKQYEDAVSEALGGVKKKLKSIGEDSMEGFISGLNKKKGKVKGAIKSIMKEVIKDAKKELGIHSPSKVFASLGDFSGQGYMKGLQESLVGVKSTMASMVNRLRSGAGVVNNTNNTTNNQSYVQNIYSPKAISRADLYRQTKSLLAVRG